MERLVYDDILDKEDSHLWYIIKRNIVKKIIEKYLPNRCDLKILDSGCCSGKMLEVLKNYGDTYGFDIDKKSIAFSHSVYSKNTIVATTYNIPFKTKSFDVLIALDFLEHLDNDSRALIEFGRVLKQGGLCIIVVPALSFLWTRHDVMSHHKRRYQYKDLNLKLKRAGFSDIYIRYINVVFFIPTYILSQIEKITQKYNIKVRNFHSRFLIPVFSIISKVEILFFLKSFKSPLGVALAAVFRRPSKA